MNIIGKSREVFVLPFIDEPQVTQMQKKNQVFIAQALKDNVCIDFVQMLDRQLSIQPDDVLFNSKNKFDAQKSKTIFRTAANFKLQAQNRGMVTERDKGKNACEKVKLPQIQTVFDSPAPQDDIDQFLESPFLLLTIRFFAILYFTGLLLTDYSYRLKLQQNPNEKYNFHMSSSNIVSHHFQLLSNCAFTLQIILKMFSKKSFFHNPWNIVTFVGCLACWSCLFMDLPQHDGQPLFHLFFILKILFGVRIIEVFQFIKNPFESFIKTIPQLRKIFFPYLIFIAMYSVLGLTLFSGANQYKCRETQQPVNGEWNQVSSNLCGASQFHCKSGFCGNPYEYGLSYNLTQRYQYGNQFGLVSFDNIGSALLITYHYVFLSNWTAIMYKFSRYMNPYMTVFYFFTLALFLFFIMSNLNMITMCKTFIENEKQKEKFKPKQNEKEQAQSKSLQLQIPEELKKFYHIVKIIDIFLIIGSAIVILIEYEGMPKTLIQLTNKIDFALTLSCLLIILIQTIILKKQILKDKLLILDWISITFSLADFIYCLVQNDSIFDPEALSSRAFRSVKIVRILKIFYFSKTWFTFQKTMLRMFVQTLDTVKYFFVLLLSVVIILAMIGQNLFANSVRLNTATRKLDIEHGQPFVTNFDSIYKAIVAVILMLQNERWTQTMYNYYSGAGWKAVGYFTIAVFIIHLLLTRLFLAIFLCYFRRNLQKTSEIEQKTLTQTKQANHRQSIQSNAAQISQFLQNQSQKMNEMDQQRIEQQKQIHFMFFRRNHCFFQLVRACYNSLILHRVLIAMILLHCLTIILRTNQDDPSKTQILNIFQTIALYFYAFQLLLGVLGFGLYWGQRTYLKQSIINYLNIIVLLLTIVSEFKFLGQLQTNLIRRFTILKILTFFTRTNKETEIVLGSISAISKKFIRMIAMYMFLLILSCTLPLKLEKHKLTTCYNYPSSQLHPPSNYHQCMLVGGDWVNDPQKFANIFQSIVLMYQVVTSESWTYFIQMFGHSSPWDIFFVLNFFVYNICLLNIFVGITVQTYLSLKDEAYKLNLLRPNQRMWLLIRNSINSLIPTPIIQLKQGGSVVHKLAFYIISQPIYENFIDVLPYINMLFYALRYYRADVIYLSNLNIANNVFLTTFMIDTFLKLQLRSKFFYLDNSRIQLAGFIYHIAYGLIFLIASPNQESQRALRFVSALLLILRCKKLLFRFTWSKTLLNSVLEVLPKCVIIGQLLMIILFFYVSIGMEIFKYTKPTPKSDGYVTGFNNAFTSLITLLKIVSNESWFDQVAAFVRPSSPIDICFPVNTIQDAIIHPGLGCGSKAGYLYFITFHMIIALLVMNLLIATMVAAYDQNYEKQYKSVNIFQLQDCLKLWKKYDPDGTGVIPYKQFWRLSSQIAILFGISKKKLIKGKQKFLEQLDIEVCQPIDRKNSSVLCYKFHDVLTKFSKIKLTVSKADCDQNNQYADFQIHPLIEHEIKDYITKVPTLYENIKPYKNYKSGEMKYFFGLLRKMRAWRIVAKKKDSSVISKLSHIIQLALQKKQKQQAQMSHIRTSISNMHFS